MMQVLNSALSQQEVQLMDAWKHKNAQKMFF